MTFEEILLNVNVECKDDGVRFTETERLEAIERLLEDSAFELIHRSGLHLLYAHKEHDGLGETKTLISSHVDCVYSKCWTKPWNEDGWIGTFDNSATNTAVVMAMRENSLPKDTLVAFTGDEEKDSRGAIEVMKLLGGMAVVPERVLVTDVTNVGFDDEADFSIENDRGIDIFTGYNIGSAVMESGYACAFRHFAEPDESWDYSDGIEGEFDPTPCLSLCLPVGGELHSDDGVRLRRSSVMPYVEMLCAIAKI
jgi:hypothetical protein